MRADLHTHSTVSDGSDSIEQIAAAAKSGGLDAVAITDHDTVSHFNRIPNGSDILILAGIEISAIHRASKTKAHILGYNIKEPEMVERLTLPLLEARSRNTEKQAEILMKHGYSIDLSKVERADGKYFYKQHIMSWLVDTGQVTEMFGDFYKQFFKNGGPCDMDIDYIDLFEAARVITRAGGQAVLAHPGQQKNFWLIPELKEAGLKGLELNHPENNEEDRKRIRELAGQYGLFMTGGSDYHGRYEKQALEIGSFLADESGAAVILN